MILWFLVACLTAPLRADVWWADGGIEVRASHPVQRVEVARAGAPVARRVLPRASSRVRVEVPRMGPGPLSVAIDRGGSWTVDVPVPPPVSVAVEAPAGQGRRVVEPGDTLPVTQVGAGKTPVLVALRGQGEATVQVGPQRFTVRLPGHVRFEMGDGSTPVTVVRGAHTVGFTLDPVRLSPEEARERLVVDAIRMPVGPRGAVDRARPPDRVTLPAVWWTRVLRGAGLGYRPRDDQAPWTWQAVALRNVGDEPMNVVVSAQVLDADDAPAPAFRPRLREVETLDAVRVLVRVPAHDTARAVLPVFVDAQMVPPDGGTWQRRIVVTPLGGGAPLAVEQRQLYVTRGNRWASLGFSLALGASLLGWVVLWRQRRRWIEQRRTSELMTISLIGSLTFVVGAASQLVGMGVASVLGPFAPLVMGLFDDAFRACLLGTLVVLVPRPGVVTLATLVGYLMRALALGATHPVDVLYIGAAVFFLEGALWTFGLTRGSGAWRDEARWRQWMRLTGGFGVANVLATATSLLVSVVVYRLYYADWYVVLILALPGFLYVSAGCWLAVGFAAGLREVEP